MTGIRKQILTIASGQTVSDAFDGTEMAAYGLQMPAAFTGASITFQVSADGTTFQRLNEVSDTAVGTAAPTKVLVTAGENYDLPPALTEWTHFKIVSASAEGAERLLKIIGKRP